MEKTVEIEVIKDILQRYGFHEQVVEQKAYIHAIKDNGWMKLIFCVTLENAQILFWNYKWICLSDSRLTYMSNQSGGYTGLNTDALSMVIDFAQIRNRRECKVNEYDAFQCEIDDRTYLCWTISPKISCVIEYQADAVEEADIFRMAESVLLPDE